MKDLNIEVNINYSKLELNIISYYFEIPLVKEPQFFKREFEFTYKGNFNDLASLDLNNWKTYGRKKDVNNNENISYGRAIDLSHNEIVDLIDKGVSIIEERRFRKECF